MPRKQVGGIVRLLLAGAAAAAGGASGAKPAGDKIPTYSSLVYPDASGRLVYAADAAGNIIPDFSYAGYMGGGVRIPDVASVLTVRPDPQSPDDAARIQAAIDEVSGLPINSFGFRGAVLLLRGQYTVSRPLVISASGVVLRGEGPEEHGTVLRATMKKAEALIRIAGSAGRVELRGTRHRVIDVLVTTGQHQLQLDSAAGLHVGDSIVVQRDTNEKWIQKNGMDDLGVRSDGGKVVNWTPGLREAYERTIVAIRENQITLDIPLTTTLEAEYGGAIVCRFEAPGRIRQVGVENLRAISVWTPGPGVAPAAGEDYGVDLTKPANRGRKVGTDDLLHANTFVSIDKAENAWVREFACRDFMYSGVEIERNAARVTVQDGSYEVPDPALGYYRVEPHDKAARYAFCTEGQFSFFQRCVATHARHSFMTQSEVPGPTVFLDCEAPNQDGTSQTHQRWSTGALYDCVGRKVPTAIEICNRKDMGTGHGWSGAFSMVWNCVGNPISVEAPPTAPNWSIGCAGTRSAGPFEPLQPAVYQSWGVPVLPLSLYRAQLKDRLGPAAIENIERHPLLNEEGAVSTRQ
jgi:hypothetical protein